MTEYYTATDTSSLNSAFKDIEEDTERKNTKWATTKNYGWISLDDISFANNSEITFYTGDSVPTDSTTIVKYDNLQAFKDAKDSNGKAYYQNNKFNLKQFLIDNNAKIDAGDTINMQVYTVE